MLALSPSQVFLESARSMRRRNEYTAQKKCCKQSCSTLRFMCVVIVIVAASIPPKRHLFVVGGLPAFVGFHLDQTSHNLRPGGGVLEGDLDSIILDDFQIFDQHEIGFDHLIQHPLFGILFEGIGNSVNLIRHDVLPSLLHQARYYILQGLSTAINLDNQRTLQRVCSSEASLCTSQCCWIFH